MACERINLQELEVQSDLTNQQLRDLYVRAKRQYPEELAYGRLPLAVRAKSDQTFERWVRGEKKELDSQEVHGALAHKIAEVLDTRSRINEEISKITRHDLFHTLARHLDIKRQTLDDSLQEMVGIYRIWRPSAHWPGRVVLGMLEVYEDDCCLCTRETYRFDSEGKDLLQQEQVLNGYLLRKRNQYYVIACDVGEHSMQVISMVASLFRGDGAVSALEGGVFCVFANRVWTSKVYVERWPLQMATEDQTPEHNRESLLKSLNLLDITAEKPKVPELVLAKLRDLQVIDGFSIRLT